MIGKLTGTIDSVGEDFAILDVHGVGYLVHCSARTLQELPAVGEAVALAIETHVREDQIRLFGFLSGGEREWFRLLHTVQGVGTKVALAILSTLKPADLATAIAMRDKAQIRMMLGVLLPKAYPASHDAADALAVAITHAHYRQSARFSLPPCGGGSGWGVVPWGTDVSHLPTPTPAPSPQGGGEKRRRRRS